MINCNYLSLNPKIIVYSLQIQTKVKYLNLKHYHFISTKRERLLIKYVYIVLMLKKIGKKICRSKQI